LSKSRVPRNVGKRVIFAFHYVKRVMGTAVKFTTDESIPNMVKTLSGPTGGNSGPLELIVLLTMHIGTHTAGSMAHLGQIWNLQLRQMLL
jgi:hypothetical protein